MIPRRRPAGLTGLTGLAIAACLLTLPACTDPGTGPEDAPALVGEPTIVFHPNQPMVVDVELELDRPGEIEAEHASDPGVQIVGLPLEAGAEDEGTRHHLRVRGLSPDAAHELQLVLRDADTGAESEPIAVEFDTDPALPGFIASFDVEAPDPDAVESVYRMFDHAVTTTFDPTTLFVVDAQGVTRWHYEGGAPLLPGPTALWTGVELLDDGSLLVARDGAVIVIDELGEQTYHVKALELGLAAPFHHDAIALPNGNFLTLGNSFQDVDYSSIGGELLHVAGELIVELSPAGTIVWTWNAFDHLDPLRIRASFEDHTDYLDWSTNQASYDWTHGNGLVYSAERDEILLSMRHQDWIIAIDHATGEVRWRLGDEGDFDLSQGRWFHHQHSAQWQDDGTLVLYDNDINDPDVAPADYQSRAVRYALDTQAMTATQVWDSSDADPAYSPICGDVDRTPGGKLLVLDSALGLDITVPPPERDWSEVHSQIREFEYEGPASSAWTLTSAPGSMIYRAVPSARLPGEALDP